MKNRRSLAYRERALQGRWLEAADQFPVLFLTGPRQVGKTTVLQYLCEAERRYVTLDDLAVRTLARQDPELFLQRFPPPVLIDEVQYAPQLLSSIKLHVDRQRQPGAFWLTGSQQFSLMKGITETLAGRVAIVNLLGFSRREKEQRAIQLSPFLPTPECIEERLRSAAVIRCTLLSTAGVNTSPSRGVHLNSPISAAWYSGSSITMRSTCPSTFPTTVSFSALVNILNSVHL
jgi:hypothetical protein